MPTALLAVHGQKIKVRLSESSDRPLMILIRMASGGMHIWDTIWNDLAEHYLVANFDLHGLLNAELFDDPHNLFAYLADACAQVASGLGHDRFSILGWNGGCQVAERCAVDFSARVDTCILLDPFFELDDMRRVNHAIDVKRVLFCNPDRRVYAYYWVMAGFSDRFLDTNFDVVDQMVDNRLSGDTFIRTEPEKFLKWVRALRTNWITDAEFGQIGARTLILATELDRWSAGPNPAMARQVHARITGSTLKILEGVGGHFLIEDPGLFRQAADEFLSRPLE